MSSLSSSGGIFDFSSRPPPDKYYRVTIPQIGLAWFVGRDVAEALGYVDLNKAIAMHVEPEDKLNDKTSSSLGQRGVWLINESGLYSLILSIKLPKASATSILIGDLAKLF